MPDRKKNRIQRESHARSLAKAISWRVVATSTTIIIVYLFFGRIDLAAAVGGIETLSKLLLYYGHERAWAYSRAGRTTTTPFVLWFTGIPCSGKSTIADIVAARLLDQELPVERIDSKDIRPLFPSEGFSRDERLRYMRRIALLARMFERHGIIVVASFVSPYEEGRKEVERMTQNFVEVHVKASVEACRSRDVRGLFERAERGEIPNFTGVSDVFEEPKNPALVIDTETADAETCARIVIDHVLERFTTRE